MGSELDRLISLFESFGIIFSIQNYKDEEVDINVFEDKYSNAPFEIYTFDANSLKFLRRMVIR